MIFPVLLCGTYILQYTREYSSATQIYLYRIFIKCKKNIDMPDIKHHKTMHKVVKLLNRVFDPPKKDRNALPVFGAFMKSSSSYPLRLTSLKTKTKQNPQHMFD